MKPGLSRASCSKLLLAAALGGFIVAVDSAHGGSATRGDLLPGIDVVFEAAESTFAPDAAADVDLHDGRSQVPVRWQANFQRFARSDRIDPPAAGGVVFVGSSSIDFWSDLPAQFPTHRVIQRGLAGATMADCTRHVDRLILPYRPRVAVVYAGDNDLAAGVTPQRIVADYAELVRRVHAASPTTRLVFVSIKPSPSRAALMPLIRQTNALMAAYARTDRQLEFVDVFAGMLDGDDHARRELFLADGLHMTSTGYALWREALVAHLD